MRTASRTFSMLYFATSLWMRCSATLQAPSEAWKSPSRSSGTRMLAISSIMAARLTSPREMILIGGIRTPS